MRQLDAPPQATDECVLGAPVQLKGFARFEFQRDEGALGRRQALFDLPLPGKRTRRGNSCLYSPTRTALPHLPFSAPLSDFSHKVSVSL